MLPNDLRNIQLLTASAIVSSPEAVSAEAGVYLFFLRGGRQLLRATSYPPSALPLLSTRGRQHMYTGASLNVRERLKAHLRADVTSSPLCRSLMAIEKKHKAIWKSGTSWSEIAGEKSLALWLCANATIGIELHTKPFWRERELLSRYASPLNIALRRKDAFARALAGWRCAAFPSAEPSRARAIRNL